MNSRIGWVALAAGLLVAGCKTEGGKGAVSGRVLDVNGQPARNVRVMLDDRDGRATMSNAQGEFRLGASAGTHLVLAKASAFNAGASLAVEVADGETENVGDVTLQDCDDIVVPMGGPEGDPTGGGSNDGGSNGDAPGDEPGEPGDPTYPCEVDPPPPPPNHIEIASFQADYAAGWLDSYGIYGYGDDSDAQAGLDFFVAGDFTSGGTVTVHIDNTWTDPTDPTDPPQPEPTDPNTGTGPIADWSAYVGLYTYDSYGYYYYLTSGDVTVTVSDDGDNDPSTMAFTFDGTNLEFAYADWFGGIGGQTASVGEADVSGSAWVYVEPAPPTADITIDTFVADWKEIYLCTQCVSTGADAIYVYAYDSTNGADLSLFVPVSSLTVPGDSLIEGSWDFANEVYGSASYYGADGASSWYYNLNHATLSVGGPIVVGEELSLNLANGQFDYAWAGGYVTGGVGTADGAEPGNGTGVATSACEEENIPEAQFHLFITAADLSGIVTDMNGGCGDGTVPPEPGDPLPNAP